MDVVVLTPRPPLARVVCKPERHALARTAWTEQQPCQPWTHAIAHRQRLHVAIRAGERVLHRAALRQLGAGAHCLWRPALQRGRSDPVAGLRARRRRPRGPPLGLRSGALRRAEVGPRPAACCWSARLHPPAAKAPARC